MKVNIQKAIMRVLPVLLTLTITVTAIFGGAVHASAADLADKAGWINLLDYTTVESASNFFVVSGTKEVTVALPYQTNLFYVDMVLYVNGSGLTSATAMWNSVSNSTSLDIYSLGNGLFRVYGSVPSGNYSNFKFSLTSSGTSYVTCQSLRVCTVSRTLTPETGYIYADGATQVEMSSPGKMISYIAYAEGGASGYGVEAVRFNSRNWYKYDCVEYIFQVVCYDINVIFAEVGSYSCPVELTYFQNDNDTGGSRMGNYYVIASVDLSGVPRDLAYDLSLAVTCGVTTTQCDIYLHDVYGITYIEPPSPLRYWFTSLFGNLSTWFTNVINTVNTGFSNVGNWLSTGFESVVNKLDVLVNGTQEQQNAADNIQGAVDDYNNQMQGIERPDISDGQFDADTVIGAGNLGQAVGLYSNVAQHEVASNMITIVVIFMLGAYVLFGKRV